MARLRLRTSPTAIKARAARSKAFAADAPIDLDALAAKLAPLIADAIAPLVADLLAVQLTERLAAQMRGVVTSGDDYLLSSAERAAAVGRSLACLELWRARGGGPAWVRVGGRAVGYPISGVKKWLADRRKTLLDRPRRRTPLVETVETAESVAE